MKNSRESLGREFQDFCGFFGCDRAKPNLWHRMAKLLPQTESSNYVAIMKVNSCNEIHTEKFVLCHCDYMFIRVLFNGNFPLATSICAVDKRFSRCTIANKQHLHVTSLTVQIWSRGKREKLS